MRFQQTSPAATAGLGLGERQAQTCSKFRGIVYRFQKYSGLLPDGLGCWRRSLLPRLSSLSISTRICRSRPVTMWVRFHSPSLRVLFCYIGEVSLEASRAKPGQLSLGIGMCCTFTLSRVIIQAWVRFRPLPSEFCSVILEECQGKPPSIRRTETKE